MTLRNAVGFQRIALQHVPGPMRGDLRALPMKEAATQ
jgi:hypothetical protein